MSQADFSSETRYGMIDASLMNNNYQIGQFTNSLADGKFANDVTVAKLQDLFKVGAADTFRIASEYRRDNMTSYPIAGATLTSQTGALSGMWDHAISKDFSLLNAVRGDRFWMERSGPFLTGTPYTNDDYNRALCAWSFNSALVYRPTQLDSVKVSAARGLQLPSLTEFGIMRPVKTIANYPYPGFTTQINSIGNPNLNPTKTMHYELSYDRQFPKLDTSGRLAVFHQVITDVRDFTNVGNFFFVPPATLAANTSFGAVGSAHVDGLEAELKGRIDQTWRWGVNYSYEVVLDDSAADAYHDYSSSTPHHKANVSLGWDHGPWEADGYLRYVSKTQLIEQVAGGGFSAFPVAPVCAYSQRIAYNINPDLRLEGNGTSGFADNPVNSEKRRVMFSVIAKY